jgi:signal transduction histidine kinase/CHASE3 domain sensor protein
MSTATARPRAGHSRDGPSWGSRIGLTPRILIAGGLLVALLVVEFVLLGLSFRTVGTMTGREQHAEESIVAATMVEKLILDLETGTRGYVITHDIQFLEPWRAARAALPMRSDLLERLAPGPRTMAIRAGWQSYLRDYSVPLIRLEQRNRQAASSIVATGEGKRRVDRIRGLIDPFVRETMRAAAHDRSRITHIRSLGRAVLLIISILDVLGVVALLAYVVRVLVAPMRRAAAATKEVAAGRPVALSERAPGEVGQLAVAFNEMSLSLERSQRSLAEQNDDLERLANVLRAVLDATVDGILLSDRDGTVQLANRPLRRIATDFGMATGPNVVDNLLSIADQMADPGAYRDAIERLRAVPDESTFDEFELAESGRVFQGFTSPVNDMRGVFVGRIWTLREVTQQRELDRMKDEFVATVSHELRTPLTSMMGFLEMVREGTAGELTSEQRRFLGIAYRSSERLQRLVGDLLFVSRIDVTGLEVRLDDVCLDALARESLDAAGGEARRRDIDFRDELDVMPLLRADRERLAQLVDNLLSNALKFTPVGGTITVRTSVESGSAVLEVEDTGIGIPAREQGHLFERFFRSSLASAQAIPGTGLGLVIAKAIVDAHGGAIEVRSEAGAGTCVRVALPFDRPEEPDE